MKAKTSSNTKTKNRIAKKPLPWTIERLISLIEKNNGPHGLDLSGQDLLHVDWSAEAVAYQLKKRGYVPGKELPVWASPFSARGERGINLEKVNFEGANLRFANLSGADMTWCNLRHTDLRDTRLHSVNFYHSDFFQARLWRADLRRATLNNANLTHASLYRAEFEDTEFLDADLSDTLLHRADLSKIIIRRNSLPNHLTMEDFHKHSTLVKWDEPEITPNEWNREVEEHVERARDAYRGLKISFSNNGMYQDASWAYFRERVMERRMHGINQVPIYFGDQIEGKNYYFLRSMWLQFKHFFIWLAFWFEELTCGYGEKPWRTLWFAAASILAFSPLYWLSGGISDKLGQTLTWSDYLIYSMGAFATVNLPRFDVGNTVAELLTSLEALLGIAILALLMFALGNRISRS